MEIIYCCKRRAGSVPEAGPISYILTINNADPSATTNMTIRNKLPEGTGFLSTPGSGWGGSEATCVVTCMRPNFGVVTAPTLTVNLTAPIATGTKTHKLHVKSTRKDHDVGTNGTKVETNVIPHLTFENDGITDDLDPGYDNDAITNVFESANGRDRLSTGRAMDNAHLDGLNNVEEFDLGGDVNNLDTDANSISAGEEVAAGGNPLVN
ncbi:MAG: hypothetical protein OEQ18_17480, partial [Gammaproteobacteria bacterium]|nr:hypothetical protein [Gammaproteobacteria bacterium]